MLCEANPPGRRPPIMYSNRTVLVEIGLVLSAALALSEHPRLLDSNVDLDRVLAASTVCIAPGHSLPSTVNWHVRQRTLVASVLEDTWPPMTYRMSLRILGL
jgi:hypothetical protein